MENVGLFYDHLEQFTAVWPFGIVVICCIFPILVCLVKEKSGNTGSFLASDFAAGVCARTYGSSPTCTLYVRFCSQRLRADIQRLTVLRLRADTRQLTDLRLRADTRQLTDLRLHALLARNRSLG
jgi:hypothetical protein